MSKTAAPATLPTVQDFPDRLPAMLVKELRQGLRARLFGETMAGFHLVIMVLILPVVSLAAPTEAAGIQRLVWWIFAALLVVLLPLRGLSAMTQERRANTLDTLLLTNLKAGRIVRGKWLAIAAQVLLVGLSVMPYLIILYAGGGISLPGSVLTLGRLILAGLVLTAAYVALSWNDSWLHRAIPGLGLAWLAMTQYAWPHVAGLQGDGLRGGLTSGPWPLFSEAVVAAVLIFILLEGTAQRLAPGVENHQAAPRLAAMLLPVSGLLIPDPAVSGGAVAALLLVSLTALTEPWPVDHPPPRGWKGWPGLAAGWPHGILWAVAAWGGTAALWQGTRPDLTAGLVRPAAWLFCGWLLLWAGPARWRERPWWLAGTALVFWLGQAILALGGQLLDQPGLSAAAQWLPVPFPGFGAGSGSPGDSALPWIAAGAASSCLMIAGMALQWNRFHRKEGGT